MIRFTESGMDFEFAEDNCFRIEEDPLVKGKPSKSTSNNMACEFVSFIDGYHCFIEAKSSVPRKADGKISDVRLNDLPLPDSWKIYDNYQNFLRSITKKFIDSFHILRAIAEERQGRQRLEELPLKVKSVDLDKLRFILIINFPVKKRIDKRELVTLTEAIKNEMRPFLKIWNIHDSSVKVLLPTDAKMELKIPIK
ncbi:MAG: hypothetical protein K2L11_08925 [Muribaculaceae bacterium]|nr:hypothetical protein [Muribaculaceae bacterium]